MGRACASSIEPRTRQLYFAYDLHINRLASLPPWKIWKFQSWRKRKKGGGGRYQAREDDSRRLGSTNPAINSRIRKRFASDRGWKKSVELRARIERDRQKAWKRRRIGMVGKDEILLGWWVCPPGIGGPISAASELAGWLCNCWLGRHINFLVEAGLCTTVSSARLTVPYTDRADFLARFTRLDRPRLAKGY